MMGAFSDINVRFGSRKDALMAVCYGASGD